MARVIQIKMKAVLFYMLVALTTTNDNMVKASTLSKARMVNVLQGLCSGANICRENTSATEPNNDLPPGFVPCCMDCSCEADCMIDRNCCFPDDTSSKQEFYNLTSHTRTEVECLFPTSIQAIGKGISNYQSYLMVTSLSRNGNHGNSSVSGGTSMTKCGDVKVAPWGSLYPVYSHKTKRLYKNAACAEADDVDDIKTWDTILVCDGSQADMLQATDYMYKIFSGLHSEKCQIQFIYKGNISDLNPFKCFPNKRDECRDVDFQVPPNVNLSQEEIREACSAGPISPYMNHEQILHVYANAFCFICNNLPYSRVDICKESTVNAGRLPSGKRFIGLLSGHFAAPLNSFRGISPPKCLDKMKLECREIFCPSAQLRDLNGKCRYLHDFWYEQEYAVVIELTSNRHINVNDTLDLKSRLISPWPEPWGIVGLFLPENEERSNFTNICVVLRRGFAAIRPNILIQNIKTMINREWRLVSNNDTYTFTSRFMKIAPYESAYGQLIVGNCSETIPWIKFSPLFITFTMQTMIKHYVTKMYTCAQIELEPAEFITSKHFRALYIKHSKRILFEFEFALISQEEGTGSRARVCIEDSGLYQNGRFLSSGGNHLFAINIVASRWISYMVIWVAVLSLMSEA